MLVTKQTSTTTQNTTAQSTATQNTTTQNTTSQSTTNTNSDCDFEPVPAPPIIDTILADVNAIIPNFSSLVASYRLLVGSAEEISRTPNVCPEVFERSVRRYDNTGTLIDILLDLLCCKIAYSSEFLSVSCAPVDLFRLLASRCNPCDRSYQTADQIITLEALRKTLTNCLHVPCFSCNQVICPGPRQENSKPPPSTAGTNTTPADNNESKPFNSAKMTAQETTVKHSDDYVPPRFTKKTDTTTDTPSQSRIRRRHI